MKNLRIWLLALLSGFVLPSIAAQTTTPADRIAALDQERIELETRLRLEETQSQEGSDNPAVREIKNRLLEVSGEEEEAKNAEGVNSKGWFNDAMKLSVPVLYVTERAKNSEGQFTSDGRSADLEYGKADTRVATVFAAQARFIPGATTLPKDSEANEAHVTLAFDQTAFLRQLRILALDSRGQKRKVLLFVHGYASSFESASLSTAFLASEMDFPVIPVSYSWVSAGTYVGYAHDEDAVRISTRYFTSFLKALLREPGLDVTVICHSMGARIVASSLSALVDYRVPTPALRNVIFVAGDISREEFAKEWISIRKLSNVRFSFYASNRDIALRLSKIVHGYPRLGDAKDLYVPVRYMTTTIDASSVDSVWVTLGHVYITRSAEVGSDIATSICSDLAPDSPTRGLEKAQDLGGHTYYFFP